MRRETINEDNLWNYWEHFNKRISEELSLLVGVLRIETFQELKRLNCWIPEMLLF